METVSGINARAPELALAALSGDALQEGLDCLAQGIALFDADLRLAVCNRAFAGRLGPLADLASPGTPYESLIRRASERQHGSRRELDRRVRNILEKARKGEPFSVRWSLDAGATLDLACRPLSAGGLAMTVADTMPAVGDSNPLLPGGMREILERSPIAVSIVGPEGRLLFRNERWSEMAGIRHDDPAPDLRAMFKNPEDRERLKEALLDHGYIRDAEIEFLKADGEPMWVLVSMHRMDIAGQRVTIGSFSDITDRKRTENALRDSEERFRAVVAHSPAAIFLKDLDGRYILSNQVFDGWMDAGETGLIGKTAAHYMHEAQFAEISEHERHVVAAGTAIQREVRTRFADGVTRDTLALKFPVLGADGRVVAVGAVETDITERKQAERDLQRARTELERRVAERTHDLAREVKEHERTEKALRESQDRLRDLAEAGSDWFWEMDREFRFTHVSSSARTMLGVDPAVLVGRKRWDFARDAGDAKWRRHIDDLENHRPFRGFQFDMIGPDGQVRYIEASGKPVFDETGGFVGYRGTGTNVTVRVEAEKRAAEAQAQLIDAIESMTDAFVLFDADERFVLCNSRYREYYPMAARTLKPGLPFRELIESGIRDGEMAETGLTRDQLVEERLARFRAAGEPFVHQLQGGRWIRVSEHKTADGGTVSIRTDITDLRRAEAELRVAKEEAERAEEQLTTAIESLSEAFILFDADDRFVLCNTKYKEYYPSIAHLCVPGVAFEEILHAFARGGQDPAALTDPDGWVERRMARHRDPKEPFLQRLSDGRWLRNSERRTEDGGVVSLRADITDLVEAEQRAERAQAQLTDAIESLSDAFILFDAEDRFVIGNERVRELYASIAELLEPGVTFEEMLRTFVERGGIEDAKEDPEEWVRGRLQRHRNPGEPHVYRLGSGRWMRISEHKTKDGGIVSIRTDITPIVEAERRANEAQAQLSDAIESISEAFILFDADDRFVLCNSKFREYYPITSSHIEERITFKELVRLGVAHGELLDLEEPLDAWLDARVAEHYNPTAPHTHHLSSGRWMRVSDGRTESGGFVSVRTDITDLRRAQEELHATNQELEAFAYSVSHDLRAPLRTMDGFCQALLEDYAEVLDPVGRDYLGRVRAGSQRMAQLIDELLELSRVTRADLDQRQVDLSAMAWSVANSLRESAPAREVDFAIDAGITAHGDSRLLRVLLENLIGNAWKFTSKHSRAKIAFGTSVEGGRKTYYVRDDGAGFDMNYADKLFKPFQRLHGLDEFEGTGIGLATVARIVARHGGMVWARSRVEAGTTVYFTL